MYGPEIGNRNEEKVLNGMICIFGVLVGTERRLGTSVVTMTNNVTLSQFRVGSPNKRPKSSLPKLIGKLKESTSPVSREKAITPDATVGRCDQREKSDGERSCRPLDRRTAGESGVTILLPRQFLTGPARDPS